MSDHIGIVAHDGWLEPFENAIRGRHDHAEWMVNRLTQNKKIRQIRHRQVLKGLLTT